MHGAKRPHKPTTFCEIFILLGSVVTNTLKTMGADNKTYARVSADIGRRVMRQLLEKKGQQTEGATQGALNFGRV